MRGQSLQGSGKQTSSHLGGPWVSVPALLVRAGCGSCHLKGEINSVLSQSRTLLPISPLPPTHLWFLTVVKRPALAWGLWGQRWQQLLGSIERALLLRRSIKIILVSITEIRGCDYTFSYHAHILGMPQRDGRAMWPCWKVGGGGWEGNKTSK